MHTTFTPCSSCAHIARRPYWLHYEWRIWLPFCATCARAMANHFTPASAIAEAQRVIVAHQQQTAGAA